MILKPQSIKEQTEKLDLINIEILCASKATVKRMERQTTSWEKIFGNHIYERGLVLIIYKDLLHINKKKTQLKHRQKI